MGDLTKRNRRWVWALLVLAILLAAFATQAGYLLVINSPQPSDVILVLAGETDQRPQRAFQLLHQGYARRIVLDVPAEGKEFGFSDVELAQKYLQQFPDAASVSICPTEGLSTRDESHDAEKCLQKEAGNRILLVTTDFHTRRALSVFRHELRGRTFSVAAAHEDREFGESWWRHREWAKTCLYEWLRWTWWNAVDRWR
jgi:uncharacterized SAM-binding protein YcdF (DUF218 family)